MYALGTSSLRSRRFVPLPQSAVELRQRFIPTKTVPPCWRQLSKRVQYGSVGGDVLGIHLGRHIPRCPR